jgi:hypothetical protein
MAEENRDLNQFMERLNSFTMTAFVAGTKHRARGQEDGLAFNYFGRCISCFLGVNTLLYGSNLLIDEAGFPGNYLESFPDLPNKGQGFATKFIGESYYGIRFLLFQNFFSQTEFTIKTIQRELFVEEGRRNPFQLAAERLEFLTANFASFLTDIRNTIHNNGYYFPQDRTDKEYQYFGKTFTFRCGEAIYIVTMEDILNIIDFVLNESIKLFEKNELAVIRPLETQ